MLPARKPLTTSNFFGKSYPRAIGTLGDEDHLVKAADGPQLPNAPFLSELLVIGQVDASSDGSPTCKLCLDQIATRTGLNDGST